MESPYQTRFSNTILTAVFAGFIATFLSFAYYLGYKDVTGFPYSALINVSSIIFLVNLFFLVVGFVYYFFVRRFSHADIFYIIFMLVVTAGMVLLASGAHRSENYILNREFHELLIGLLLIMGITAGAGIPLLYHSRKFHRYVL